jgi:hypothetical protein
MVSGRKQSAVDFSDISGGFNTAMPAHSLGKNECQKAYNTIIKEKGWEKWPGFLGIKSTAIFNDQLRGMEIYKNADAETVLSMSGGKLYSINTTTGAPTELYDLTGTGEGYFANAYNKCFVSNGAKLVKVESGNAYQVGITAPVAGASVAAAAAGTIPDGVYTVIIGYARKVSGSNVLYSQGLSLGTVTLGTGSNKIAITNIPNSSDLQVNNKIAWVKKPAENLYYYWGETGDNSTTSITLTSDTSDANLIYEVLAANNNIPSSPEFCFFFDNRLWYIKDNQFWFSLKGSTSYQLERFFDTNKGTMPFNIRGAFVIGQHLYFNTVGGIIRQPYGDVNSKYEIVDTRWYYRYIRTIDAWGSTKVIGVTNDGVRVFDQDSGFANFDMSSNVKPEIEKLYSGSSDGFEPIGRVMRRNNRTEYRLSFRDININTTYNNRTLILNLDSVVVYDNNKYKTPWEESQHGFGYCAMTRDYVPYFGQSGTSGSTIYAESSTTKKDRYIFNLAGTFLTAATNKRQEVWTRKHIENMLAITQWFMAEILGRANYDMTIEAIVEGRGIVNSSDTFNSLTGNESVFGTAVFGTSKFSIESPQIGRALFKRRCAGKSVYLKIYQDANDRVFDLISIVLIGKTSQTRFS